MWRIARCADYSKADYYSTYEYGWHVSATADSRDADTAVELALAEAERLGRPVLEHVTARATGEINPVTLVTDNGGPFRAARFQALLAGRPELAHVRTRVRTPGQNEVRERGFGSLKYEHLYRHDITDGALLAAETEGDHEPDGGCSTPFDRTKPSACALRPASTPSRSPVPPVPHLETARPAPEA